MPGTPVIETEDKTPYITVSRLGSGYAALCMEWDNNGFWDVFQTGIGRYETYKQAAIEARLWSEADGVRLNLEG